MLYRTENVNKKFFQSINQPFAKIFYIVNQCLGGGVLKEKQSLKFFLSLSKKIARQSRQRNNT
jgi:hypothetical protein